MPLSSNPSAAIFVCNSRVDHFRVLVVYLLTRGSVNAFLSAMLIVSWNVAGLSTTVNRINDAYGGNGDGKNNKKKPNLVLSEYLRRHDADIFCVQEHKIPLSQLSSRSEPLGCSDIEGYESFWSCCVDDKRYAKVEKGLG